IAPGLHKTEAKTVRPLLIASPLLFLTGAIFAYAAVLPMAWSFFVGFEVPVAQDQMAIMLEPRMTEYLSLTMVLLIAFGLSFELPILLILLAKIGLITAKSLQSKRRYAIILIFVMAAVLTPPDVVSQIALAFPLLILYEITLFLIRRMEQKQPSIQTEEQASA
ncbi:MAG: twin-arginine translocase subunit TatC, partial [Alphaproteobacteria bacterium]|nr:twin-arginine translocase subunit TatC [Alphaproteobacteria bacterium]